MVVKVSFFSTNTWIVIINKRKQGLYKKKVFPDPVHFSFRGLGRCFSYIDPFSVVKCPEFLYKSKFIRKKWNL